MSISPIIAIAALPAIQIASKAAKGVLDASVSFASHLVEPATPEVGDIASDLQTESRSSAKLDQLRPKLQQFLKSLGLDHRSPIELKSDGQQPIKVDGEPSLKQAVENWLAQNPDWAASWQSAVSEYLAKSPSGSSNPLERTSETKNPLSLRSQISSSDVEHWRSI